MRVLIVKVSALGDIVHALPVLAYLKSVVPEAEIDWLVEESFAPLLEGHPLIRRVHLLRTKSWRRYQGMAGNCGEIWELVVQMRQEKYEIALDLQGNIKSGLFSLLSGAPLRFGFDRKGVRECPNLLFTNRHVPLGKTDFHITERSLAVVRNAFPGGGGEPLAGSLFAADDTLADVDNALEKAGMQARKLIVLHSGTTWKTKLWPHESWCRLARCLCDELALTPLLTWGNEEEFAAARSIQEATNMRAVVWPRRTLKDLVALLSRVDLVVGGDTGPLHIAAAVGTPTLSLFIATDALRNGPRGPQHIHLQAPLDCSPCLRKQCPSDSECGASLTVPAVLAAVEEILQCPSRQRGKAI